MLLGASIFGSSRMVASGYTIMTIPSGSLFTSRRFPLQAQMKSVRSRILMAQSSREFGEIRYGTNFACERHDDGGNPSSNIK
jgi:hypothetical protein